MWDNWRDTRTGGVEQRFLRVIEWQLHLGLAMENILGFHWIGQYLYKVLSFNISNACGGWPRKPPSLSMLWFANWKKMPHTIAFLLSSWDSGLSKLRMPVVINCSVNVRDRRFQHGRVLWRFFTEGVFDSAWSSAEVNGWDCIWCRNRIAASDWLGWIQKRLMLFGWATTTCLMILAELDKGYAFSHTAQGHWSGPSLTTACCLVISWIILLSYLYEGKYRSYDHVNEGHESRRIKCLHLCLWQVSSVSACISSRYSSEANKMQNLGVKGSHLTFVAESSMGFWSPSLSAYLIPHCHHSAHLIAQ